MMDLVLPETGPDLHWRVRAVRGDKNQYKVELRKKTWYGYKTVKSATSSRYNIDHSILDVAKNVLYGYNYDIARKNERDEQTRYFGTYGKS